MKLIFTEVERLRVALCLMGFCFDCFAPSYLEQNPPHPGDFTYGNLPSLMYPIGSSYTYAQWNGKTLPYEKFGYKGHVGVVLNSADLSVNVDLTKHLARTVTEYLRERGIAHKVAFNIETYNNQRFSLQTGKFITIYAPQAKVATVLADVADIIHYDPLLRDQTLEGPPHEIRVRAGRPGVTYRYDPLGNDRRYAYTPLAKGAAPLEFPKERRGLARLYTETRGPWDPTEPEWHRQGRTQTSFKLGRLRPPPLKFSNIPGIRTGAGIFGAFPGAYAGSWLENRLLGSNGSMGGRIGGFATSTAAVKAVSPGLSWGQAGKYAFGGPFGGAILEILFNPSPAHAPEFRRGPEWKKTGDE